MTSTETAASSSASFLNLAALKEGLKKYGRTGIYVYLGVSFSVTAGWYVAIERNVDVKKLLGLKDDPNREPSWMESLLTGKGSHLALAILCSKVCVPIKVPVAVAMTPYVHRLKEQFFKGWAMKAKV
eukprot:CAMPEP_0202894190 /NCGR_PEP_ID=MMETSP1392-20130828/3635_1 /ASSEMBLY_ACC=CAM_ASM_000868 /TAXON_ID=225041 /ORGANISM="Chlamydomonas chlamydogama, Strain SAG 11-48b" /LENGTH=126 /DNA_ID=CAMNT_0049578797 /DNA_START=11 /DNA_END=391 /DNA_ORIENTATION=-